MRFDEIASVRITDLELDETNYRFGKALNQQDCIEKIYNHSPENFKNIMVNIAEHDLGEQLLVLKKNNKMVVLDGNRRISILKILNNPELAPNDYVKDLASKLKVNAKCDLHFVGAFVSDDLEILAKTVYERHAATGGIGRIKWSAYANARFRYNTELHGDANWISIAILIHFQEQNDNYNDFIASSQFSFETFTRIIRSAYSLGYIDHLIFNDATSILIKDTPEYKYALTFTAKVLQLLESREISLSRDGNYASAKNVELFLSKYFDIVTTTKAPIIRKTKSKKPNQQVMQEATKALTNAPTMAATLIEEENIEDSHKASGSQAELALGGVPPKKFTKLDKPTFDKKIFQNNDLTIAINSLKIPKFNLLYKSLLTIDPIEHPLITIVGIWSLLDSLARIDSNYNKDFAGYFKGKLQNYPFKNTEDSKSDKEIIDWLAKEGNFTKHSNNYASINGLEIAQKFNRVQSLIGYVVSNHISKSLNK